MHGGDGLNGAVPADPSELEAAFRAEWPQVLATLVRLTGSVELAEDAVQEAVVRALGAADPEAIRNPGAWLTQVARRVAIDTMRREAAFRRRLPLLAVPERVSVEPAERQPAGDDRLGLLLLACAPELPEATRLALALRFVCGVPTEEIAEALLVKPGALTVRLTRAKRVLQDGGVAFPDLPTALADAGARMDAVLATISVLYTTGHTAPSGSVLGSREVTAAAIELARAVVRVRPADAEASGLLALLLLTEARADGRLDESGALVTLETADRARWDAALIAEGLRLAVPGLAGGGRFGLQAGIAGLHSRARIWAETDWEAIGLLYDRLVAVWPSPSALLARVVARGYGGPGPVVALADLEALGPGLPAPLARQASGIRADLLRRAGRAAEAAAEYERAATLERNGAVRDFYRRRAAECAAVGLTP